MLKIGLFLVLSARHAELVSAFRITELHGDFFTEKMRFYRMANVALCHAELISTSSMSVVSKLRAESSSRESAEKRNYFSTILATLSFSIVNSTFKDNE